MYVDHLLRQVKRKAASVQRNSKREEQKKIQQIVKKEQVKAASKVVLKKVEVKQVKKVVNQLLLKKKVGKKWTKEPSITIEGIDVQVENCH